MSYLAQTHTIGSASVTVHYTASIFAYELAIRKYATQKTPNFSASASAHGAGDAHERTITGGHKHGRGRSHRSRHTRGPSPDQTRTDGRHPKDSTGGKQPPDSLKQTETPARSTLMSCIAASQSCHVVVVRWPMR